MNFAVTIPIADTWGMHGDFGWGGMVVMMVMMGLFWVAILFGIVWLARGGFDGWRGGRRETPTEILERRFAEGAISVDDYYERREVIGNGTRRDKGAGREADSLKAPPT